MMKRKKVIKQEKLLIKYKSIKDERYQVESKTLTIRIDPRRKNSFIKCAICVLFVKCVCQTIAELVFG